MWFVLVGLLASESAGGETPAQIFAQRILPIFRSPDPSSCTECHLSGVRLQDYILPSADQTFRSLRDQGLIDLEKPRASRILTFIGRTEANKKVNLISKQRRLAEYEAFAAWIEACTADKALCASPPLAAAERARPARPDAVIRHARSDHLLRSFENTIWALRFRCMGCHTEGTAQNDKLRAEHGDQVAWISRHGAQATMDYLRSSQLIDTKQPHKSLLLTKPLGEVKHGGGQKFVVGDQGYQAFRRWLEDYGKIVRDQYATAAQLPDDRHEPRRWGTEVWCKLSDAPPAWTGKLVQIDPHAWQVETRRWQVHPCATSDRLVSGKGGLWQHTLTLLAYDKEQPPMVRGQIALPPGEYLLKVYVDGQDKTRQDWTVRLGPDDLVGQTTVRSSWPAGYGKMTVVDARKLGAVPAAR